MYKLKLVFHSKISKDKRRNVDDDVLINPRDCPTVKDGDIIEVFHPEDKQHLLLLVKNIKENSFQKDAISVEQTIASTFRLRQYKDVFVNVVAQKDVTLDLVEVYFKDQYFSRSDFYRFTRSMQNTVVHFNKKLEYMNVVKGQIGEMWCRGEKHSCGYVGPETKVVFRSSTAVVHIFIQMSAEMWDFDFFGDLYFEKTVNFLAELFSKWNDSNCSHDVTVVLFSRIYYDAASKEHFPEIMRKYIQKDHKNRFYEDFYRVLVQNERYMEEWKRVLIDLKLCFHDYKAKVLEYQRRICAGANVPKAYNSTCAEGNFLETLNMTLNLYEHYNIDRNFDRTGKICVVITPGPGVFDVDRELVNITKQRILDLGVGIDLVCMGEQPLHAVPLFRFIKKRDLGIDTGDDYYIPHWINHSFYRSESEMQAIRMGNFIPRIKLKFQKMKVDAGAHRLQQTRVRQELIELDFNSYDNLVYALPRIGNKSVLQNRMKVTESGRHHHIARVRHTSVNLAADVNPAMRLSKQLSTSDDTEKRDRGISSSSDTEGASAWAGNLSRSAECPVAHQSYSLASRHEPRKALINPFAPNRLNIRLTANRRRWAHVFPIDTNGKPIQPHHKLDSNVESLVVTKRRKRHNLNEAWKRYADLDDRLQGIEDLSPPILELEEDPLTLTNTPVPPSDSCSENGEQLKHNSSNTSLRSISTLTDRSSTRPSHRGISRKTRNLFTEGEQKWTWESLNEDASPINHMGVDWKSLTMPACLPVTIDYFPNKNSLCDDFLLNDYQLEPCGISSEEWASGESGGVSTRGYRRRPLTSEEVFKELINQRLSQGFQIIVSCPSIPAHGSVPSRATIPKTKGAVSLRLRNKQVSEVHKFSIGRIFHTCCLEGDTITVTQYRPRTFPVKESSALNRPAGLRYKYRLKVPDAVDYVISWTEFNDQVLESFSWNYLDNYICTRGEGETYRLVPSLKFWRSRFLLLPGSNQATKKIAEAIAEKQLNFRCDIYEEKTPEEQRVLVDSFVRFMETINKIRTATQNRKAKFTFDGADTSRGKESAESTPQKPPEEVEPLSINTAPMKVLQSMIDPNDGIAFISGTPQSNMFPPYTFIAAEGVKWARASVSGLVNMRHAIDYLQSFITNKLICHASGSPTHRFIHGSYMYCLLPPESMRREVQAQAGQQQEAGDQSQNPTASGQAGRSQDHQFFMSAVGGSEHTFQYEWMEVAVSFIEEPESANPGVSGENGSGVSYPSGSSPWSGLEFLKSELPDREFENHITMLNADKYFGLLPERGTFRERNGLMQLGNVLHKKVIVDIDSVEFTERVEWGTSQYHANYHPLCSYEMELQWLVATGGKLAELLTQWNRKVNNFHFLPAPCDPFALPYTPNSDPLRGPIFVSLEIACLMNEEGKLFEEFPQNTRQTRLQLLQEAILKRFGFMPEACVSEDATGTIGDSLHLYVHCSGGMFAMVPHCDPSQDWECLPDSQEPWAGEADTRTSTSSSVVLPTHKRSRRESIHQEYIALQASTIKAKRTLTGPERVGFLWAWNYMLSKKWRNANTGDEVFQDRMLADFRAFCRNDENRLVDFWKSCQMKVLNLTVADSHME